MHAVEQIILTDEFTIAKAVNCLLRCRNTYRTAAAHFELAMHALREKLHYSRQSAQISKEIYKTL